MKYNQCLVKCKYCRHEQLHTFKFTNCEIPQHFHEQEYDFNFCCSKCKRRSTVVFTRDYYEIGLLENANY